MGGSFLSDSGTDEKAVGHIAHNVRMSAVLMFGLVHEAMNPWDPCQSTVRNILGRPAWRSSNMMVRPRERRRSLRLAAQRPVVDWGNVGEISDQRGRVLIGQRTGRVTDYFCHIAADRVAIR